MHCRGRIVAIAIAAATLFGFGPGYAQESLDQGKTPAQLFASDCAICHKSPRGLSQGGGLFGLQNFLRAHYTASIQSAAALAAYLQAVDRQAPPRARTSHRPPRQPPTPKSRPEGGQGGSAGGAGEAATPRAETDKPTDDKPAAQPAKGAPAESTPSEPAAAATDQANKRDTGAAESGSAEKREETGSSAPTSGAGDSVPNIIKPEKSD